MHRLETHIKDHFRSTEPQRPTQGLDVCVALHLDQENERLVLRIQPGQIDIHETEPEWTIYFDSEDSALALLTGQANPITQFMAGELRSSGYIVTTFHVLQTLTVLDP